MHFLKSSFTAVFISLLLSACGSTPQAAGVSDAKERPDGGSEQSRRVQTTVANQKDIEQTAVVTGTLAADQEVVLGFKVPGRVAEIPVDLGSAVQKNSPIAKLDTMDYELRVRQADAGLQQARVRLGLAPDASDQSVVLEQTTIAREARATADAARSQMERAQQLFTKGLLPKADFDATDFAYKIAETKYEDALEEARNRQALLAQRRSELEIARQQLADAVLYAPIPGVIRQRDANAGQYVAAGAPIATLVQMHPLRLKTAVPEREARSIRPGLPVRVTVEGAPGIHPGRVARISPSFDEANRTLLVETEVSNTAGILRPGAFARAEIIVSSGQRALMVPPSSIVNFAGVDRVFVVKDGKASEKRIRTGRHMETGVEVLGGIDTGDSVVINPGNMKDGETVAID